MLNTMEDIYIGPFLIFGPLSTINKWPNKLRKWAPKIPVVVYQRSMAEKPESEGRDSVAFLTASKSPWFARPTEFVSETRNIFPCMCGGVWLWWVVRPTEFASETRDILPSMCAVVWLWWVACPTEFASETRSIFPGMRVGVWLLWVVEKLGNGGPLRRFW